MNFAEKAAWLEETEAAVIEARASFGRDVKASRLAVGCTQQKLAAALGITQSSLSLYERGERRCPKDVADKAAQYLSKLIPKEECSQD